MTLKESKGYLVVASKNSNFYSLAINCIESLKDYYPEARVCLVTEESFLDGREYIADDIIFCGSNKREKLWGMSQSPYDLTMYIDADCEIEHEDIKNVFDEIDDNDMVFHELDVRGKGYFAIYNFMADNVKEYSTNDFKSEVVESDTPVLVDFWAEWCGPCKVIAPVVEELANDYEGKIKFGKVNVDDHNIVASEYGVRSIPTLLIFKNGAVVNQIVGAVPKEKITAILDTVI